MLLALSLSLAAGAWEAKSWLHVAGANAGQRIQSQLVVPPRAPARVSGLGRLEPRDGLIRVAATTQLNIIDPVIGHLLVDDGSPVAQGQIIAILQDHDALAAEVERLTAELDHARIEKKRFDQLHRESIVNEFDWDDWCLKERVAAAQLHQAEAELVLTTIRSPITGRVLKVHAREGERVGPDGIAEVGKTGSMCAIAEIYETDVRYLHVGDRATITSPALNAPLNGTVDRIGHKIGKQDLLATDPTARTDARVVEVRVRLDDSEAAADLSLLQVNVVVDVEMLEAQGGNKP